MRIAIDLRSLHTGRLSGVENYILNVVEYLVSQDTENTYTLFYNSFKPVNVEHFHFVNSKVVATRIPNKLLNSSLSFFGYPKLEKLIGDFDCLFLPNLNPFALGQDKKLALTIHDISPVVTPEFYGPKDRIWHRLLKIKRAVQRADVIFSVSQYTKDDIVKTFGVSGDKIRVVYPGIDAKIFRRKLDEDGLRYVRNRYGLPGRYLLFINTLEPRKNLKGLLLAFENLKTNDHLVIAGKPGYGYGEVLNSIRNSKKAGYIHYLGYIDEADKPYLIAQAKALVYPSFYEGFGFQPLEAMALGVPVIASQVSSLPEVSGDAALLVNPYNISDLTEAMESLVSSSEMREKLREKGFARVENFKWQKAAKKILEGLKELQK